MDFYMQTKNNKVNNKSWFKVRGCQVEKAYMLLSFNANTVEKDYKDQLMTKWF